jgi:hypothetical protein
MAGKTIESTAPTTIEEVRALVMQKYRAVPFDHPAGYGRMEVAKLKRHEYQAITEAVRRTDGTWDLELQDRMAVAFGLVEPKLAATPEQAMEELKEYPNDFIQPIAKKVWDLTNDYRNEAEKKGAGADVLPFTKTSSNGTASPPPPDASSSK